MLELADVPWVVDVLEVLVTLLELLPALVLLPTIVAEIDLDVDVVDVLVLDYR